MTQRSPWILAGLIALLAEGALAAPGDLDVTFGVGGRISGQQSGACKDVVVQPDGKILASGFDGLGQGPYGDFAVVRHLSDGSLDATFGTGGVATADSGGANDNPGSMLLQPDGKIVQGGQSDAGATNADFTLVRYNGDGSLDPSFGGGGIVTTVLSASDDHIESLALQPDGKIVAAGNYNDAQSAQRIAIARYDGSGNLDPSFGTSGIVTLAFGVQDAVLAVALQPDGKIVIAGQTGHPGPYDFLVARYEADGTLDVGFGTGGIVVTDFGGNETARSLVIDARRRILVGGYTSSGLVVLARYDSTGMLDATFGTGGRVIPNFGSVSNVIPIALYEYDRLVAAGTRESSPDYEFLLARLDAAGALDPNFANGIGFTTTPFASNDDEAQAIAVQPDGRIVVCGFAKEGPGGVYSFAIARYLGDDPQCEVARSASLSDLAECHSDLSACTADLAATQAALEAATADADGDGVRDLDDDCPGSAPAAPVDQAGCSPLQFCALTNASTTAGQRTCKKLDWRNDEPMMGARDRDCAIDRGGAGISDDLCVPAS